MCKDKNGVVLNIGDYICICNEETAYEIKSETSVGVNIEYKHPISEEVLKKDYRKHSNTFGFIPLDFISQKKIKLCTPEEYPECYI